MVFEITWKKQFRTVDHFDIKTLKDLMIIKAFEGSLVVALKNNMEDVMHFSVIIASNAINGFSVLQSQEDVGNGSGNWNG